MQDLRSHKRREAKKIQSDKLIAHANGVIGRAKQGAITERALREAIDAGKLTKCKASKRKPYIRKRYTGI